MCRLGYFFFVSLIITACDFASPCTQKQCVEAVRVNIIENGEPVHVFEGSVTLWDEPYEFGCNTAYPNQEGPVVCGDFGVLVIEASVAKTPTFFVTVRSDTNGYFSRMVEPTYQVDENFNGEGCGSCPYGEADVVLVR